MTAARACAAQRGASHLPLVVALVGFAMVGYILFNRTPAPTEEYMSIQNDYLQTNAQKEGVIVTASGLQIRHEVVGEGAQPSASNTVTVHYAGRLIDGTQFDSSYDRKQPLSFPLNRVIAGWTEGLQLMREGGKAELTIPAALGYGNNGAGSQIPGGATLVFTVELLQVR